MQKHLRLGDILSGNAEVTPEEVAIIDRSGETTWGELEVRANKLANGLLELGLNPGDRVATLARNSGAVMEVAFGLARAGLVSVPLNFGLTKPELQFLIEDSAPHAFIVGSDVGEAFEENLRGRPRVFVLGSGDTGFEAEHTSYGELTLGARDGAPKADVDPDDLRTIRYTSGTTGTPKACMGTHRQMLASIDNFLGELPIPERGPYLQVLPLFSGAGIWMAVCAAYAGQATVMLERFTPASALEAVDRHEVTHTYAVPTIIGRLADEFEKGSYRCASLELIGYGGSPMPRSLIERALRVLPCGFYQGFGGGEMGGLVTYLRPEDHEAIADPDTAHRVRSVGRPARYATVKVIDDRGGEVPVDELGEIVVLSPSNFSGYWNRPDETAETLRDGWVYTGDIGYFDEDGYLYAVDRKKDLVLSGGMNVSSAEVEEAVMEHPAVASAAVVGIEDESWGEAVTAVVVLSPGAEATEAEIKATVRARLAGYKTPKHVVFMDQLPQNSAGKILKRELRDLLNNAMLEEGRGRA